MKKIWILLIALLTLTACAEEPGTELQGNLFVVIDSSGSYEIVRDTDTGCIYYHMSAGHSAALSPYYDEEGNVAGCGEQELDKEKYGWE